MPRGRYPAALFASLILLLAAGWAAPAVRSEPQDATYWVNGRWADPDANPGDGVCAAAGGVCTLRAAIDEANNDGAPSTIRFTQKFQGGNSISDCGLRLTEANTTIDASDQWDASGNRPGVEIVKQGCDALILDAGQTTVKGLLFWHATGIYVRKGGYNTIGGLGSGERNVFVTGPWGVWLAGGVGYNHVVGNYFGLVNYQLQPAGAGSGIMVPGEYNTIERNTIAGDNGSRTGIYIDGNYTSVFGNEIGRNQGGCCGWPLYLGIHIWSGHNNTIGPGNLIAGNAEEGILVQHGRDNTIAGNDIGVVLPGGDGGNGKDGIRVFGDSPGTKIQGNDIQANGGLGVRLNSPNATLEGNVIANNGAGGVYLNEGGTTIGGGTNDGRNEILSNKGHGVHLDGASNVTIRGNLIGLSKGWVPYVVGANEGYGILAENGVTLANIGGPEPGQGNWIAASWRDGIRLTGAGTSSNFVQGNVLGARTTWEYPAPNGWHGIGLYDTGPGNFIGGLDEGVGNVILASGWSGLVLINSSGNFVLGNRIGTDGAGHDWGNAFYGLVVGGSQNFISGNEIAFNGTNAGQPGVVIDGPANTGNLLLFNSIHSHAGKGISLINGGNGGLAAPVITSASCQGPVTGTAWPGGDVEIFSDSVDEGRVYHDVTTADAGTGAFTWTGKPSGPYVTATVTDQSKNTSEFSLPFSVGTCNTAPVAKFSITPSTGASGTIFFFDASGSSDAEDAKPALKVRWDWQNDGVYDTGWSSDKTAQRRFNVAGSHTIRLEVKDSAGLKGVTSKTLKVTGSTIRSRVLLPWARR